MSDSHSEGENSQFSPNKAGASTRYASSNERSPASTSKRSPASSRRRRSRRDKDSDKILSAIANLNTKFDNQALVIEQLRKENEQLRKAVNEPPKFDFKKQNYTKEICLSELDHMRCISSKDSEDRNTGKTVTSRVLKFDFDTKNSWLHDPSPELHSGDTVGLFKSSFRRPIANRYLTLTSGSAQIEDKTTYSFMSSFPVQCNNDRLQAFLSADPLVTSITATQKKVLSLPESVFSETAVTCNEVPLFSISDYHSRQGLAVLLAMDQLNTEFKEHLRVLTENWDLNKRILVVDGKYIIEDAPRGDESTLGDSLSKEAIFKELLEMRTGFELNYFGYQSAMDYLKANIIASRHDGRKQILANLNKGPGSVAYDNLNGSAYNTPHLFGPVTDSFKENIRINRANDRDPVYLSKYTLNQPSRSYNDGRPTPSKRRNAAQHGSVAKRGRFLDSLPRNSGRGRGGRHASRPANRGRGRSKRRGSRQGPKNSARKEPDKQKS